MSYKQLSRAERYHIEIMKAAEPDISLSAIAIKLKRSRSTISREYKRNFDTDIRFYSALVADNMAHTRKTLAKRGKKLDKIADTVQFFISQQLKERSSPEQICGRLKKTKGIRISYVTLYKYIELDKLQGGKLYLNLRHGVKKYRKFRTRDNTKFNKNKKRINNRPVIADLKQEPGHWEVDTMFGLLQQSFLLTLTDKASKFQVIRYILTKKL